MQDCLPIFHLVYRKSQQVERLAENGYEKSLKPVVKYHFVRVEVNNVPVLNRFIWLHTFL